MSFLWRLVGFSLKQKLLIMRLRVLKPFSLRGLGAELINFHISNLKFPKGRNGELNFSFKKVLL